MHLSEPTRRFLEELRPGDLEDFHEAVKLMHSAKTVGRFLRYSIITVVVSFVAAIKFGEDIMFAVRWLLGLGGGK